MTPPSPQLYHSAEGLTVGPQRHDSTKGGLPLASSRFTSSTPDAVDVLAVMTAFEELNKCRLTVRVYTELRKHTWTLAFDVTAHDGAPDAAGVKCLAYRKSSLGYGSPVPMEAVILRLLYGIDADMAKEEFAQVAKE